MKISRPFLFMKKAGQAQKQDLSALSSITSLSHQMRGTTVGQGWDMGQQRDKGQNAGTFVDKIACFYAGTLVHWYRARIR